LLHWRSQCSIAPQLLAAGYPAAILLHHNLRL